MASLNLAMISIPKFRQLGATVVTRSPWRPRSIVTAAPRSLQVQHEASAAAQSVKQGANEMGNKAGNMKKKAKSGAEEMAQKTKNAASNMPETAQELGGKANKTAQDAWGAAKDTTQKIKDTMVGKAEQTAETVKKNADIVKCSMNTKN